MTVRKTVQISVQPWFKDHCFNGQSIFPAVESMLLLAGIAQEFRPENQRVLMGEAIFSKFLLIPENATELSVLVDIEEDEHSLCLTLLSRIQLKALSRIIEHATVCFPVKSYNIPAVTQATVVKKRVTISTNRIYEELVPFGENYRSLTGDLTISGNMASGTLQAPVLARQHRMGDELGSPFPLDGAMHAACVLGQCIADFVPFPVGFSERFISNPTQAGGTYRTSIRAKSATKDELLFDLSIYDAAGAACETIRGLRMRDVSRGAIKPPEDLPRITISPS